MKKLFLALALVSMFTFTACFHATEVKDEAGDGAAVDAVEPEATDESAADESAVDADATTDVEAGV